ncbi:MAG TPA: hypothetical protein VIK91_27230, partial [Nannocystis sp.]
MTAPARALVVEVVVRQGDRVVDVTTVAGRRGAFRIGEGPRAQATVAVAQADADGCFTLLGPGRRLTLPPGARGELRGASGAVALLPGASLVLAEGTCAIVHVDPLTFELTVSPAEPRPRVRPVIEWPLWLSQAASLLLFASLALLVRIHGQEPTAPRWDDPEVQERLIRYVAGLKPAVEEPRAAARRPGTIGEAARAPAIRQAVSPPPPGPASPEETGSPIARAYDLEDMSRQAGFLGLAAFDRILRDYTASLERSIAHYRSSAEQDAAWAAAAKAAPRALAGLGLGETVRGGGGEARGVLDLDLGELLAAVQKKRARGLPGQGRAEAAFRREPVRATQEAPRQNLEWTAAVGQDLIRGVIRRHTPEVRRCFREATATGRIEVAFTIASGGKV